MGAKRFAVALMLMLAVAGIATPVRSQDMVCMTIAETAVSAGLSTLVAAVDAVGLLPVVSDANTALTVLAPTDEAFADLLSAFNLTLEEVVADEHSQLPPDRRPSVQQPADRRTDSPDAP